MTFDDYTVVSYRIELIDATHGDIYVTTLAGGPEFKARTISFPSGIKAHDMDDIAFRVLLSMGYKIQKKENAPYEVKVEKKADKPTPSLFLGKADNKKIILQKVDGFKDVICYALRYKVDNKWVIKVDERGIYTSDSPKCEPLHFTSLDLTCIGNLEDFEIQKLTIKSRREVANKLYGRF